ncbi:MAG: TonB-dependent receptor [Tannerella sp.]|nr:TonB-dependent receptor [Tannerella sp.]
MKYIVYLFLMLALAFAKLEAQESKLPSELSGHVIDKAEAEHLPYIPVFIKETGASATSDASGHFRFVGIRPGKYTIVVATGGYEPFEREIELENGAKLDLSIELKPEVTELNTLIVSADRNESLRKESPTVVNVLTSAILESTNSHVLSEGLSFVPGLRVENNCQNCGYQQVRINGLEGRYSQLLIDGRPIVSALAGVYGIEQIPAGMIERVEVIRGGGSALYGSSAVGGVVNIITKEAIKNAGSLSYSLSMLGGKTADNNMAVNVALTSSSGDAGAYVFANVKNRNPYDFDGDEYTELPQLRGSTVGFRAFGRPNQRSKITFEYHNIAEKRRGGNNLKLPPHEADIAEQLEHNINGGGIKYDILSGNGKHKTKLYTSAQHTDRQSYYGTGKNPKAYGSTSGLTFDLGGMYSYSFDRMFFMPATISGGVEYNSDDLNDKTEAYRRAIKQKVNTVGLFLLNEWKNERIDLALSARLDKHSMIDQPVFCPRLNVKYNVGANLSFRANYSEGFSAPQAFSEDLHILAAGGSAVLIQLAPDLKPEHSRSLGLSLDMYRSFGAFQANLMVEGFYTSLRDVFVLEKKGADSDGNLIQEKRNGSGAAVQGINIEAKAAKGQDYTLQFGLTVQRSEYERPEEWSETGAPASKKMFRTPDFYGYFTGTARLAKGFSASASGTYTGSMYVQHLAGYIAADRLEHTRCFFNLGIKFSYDLKFGRHVVAQLNAGISNVFDAYQSDFDRGSKRDSGYIYGPVAPRSYFAGIKFSL